MNLSSYPKVAIWQPNFDQMCTKSNKNLFNCDSWLFSRVAVLLKCMGLGLENIQLVDIDVLQSFTVDVIFESVDIFPYTAIVDDLIYTEAFFVSRPSRYSIYKFFTSVEEENSIHRNWTFMTSPFTVGVWLMIILIVILSFLVTKLSRTYAENISIWNINLTNFIDFIRDFTIVIGLGFYAANLKAIINVHQRKTDFRDTAELAQMIMDKERTLIVFNSLDAYHFRVIRGEEEYLINGEYPESFRKLNRAIQVNPPVVVDSLEDLCKKLATEKDYVYMAEIDITEKCPEYCYRGIRVKEIPYGIQAFFLPKNSTWTKSLDACVNLYISYSDRETKRRTNFTRDCSKTERIQPVFISLYPLTGPFILLAFGILLSSLSLIAERFIFFQIIYRRYVIH